MNVNQAVTLLAGAILVPITIAILLVLARKSLRRMVLTLAIATVVAGIVDGLAYVVYEVLGGSSGTTLAGLGPVQVVGDVNIILAAVLAYWNFTASMLALFDSIVTHRTVWFLVLVSSDVVTAAAAQVYRYPTIYFPQSPITYIVSLLSLASVLVYGIVGMRSRRPRQAMPPVVAPNYPGYPPSPGMPAQPGTIPPQPWAYPPQPWTQPTQPTPPPYPSSPPPEHPPSWQPAAGAVARKLSYI